MHENGLLSSPSVRAGARCDEEAKVGPPSKDNIEQRQAEGERFLRRREREGDPLRRRQTREAAELPCSAQECDVRREDERQQRTERRGRQPEAS